MDELEAEKRQSRHLRHKLKTVEGKVESTAQKVRNTQRSLSRAHKRLKTEAENNAASAAADRKEFDAKISELQEEISGVRKQLRNRKDYQCKLSSDRKVLKAENAELQVQVAELSKDLASVVCVCARVRVS